MPEAVLSAPIPLHTIDTFRSYVAVHKSSRPDLGQTLFEIVERHPILQRGSKFSERKLLQELKLIIREAEQAAPEATAFFDAALRYAGLTKLIPHLHPNSENQQVTESPTEIKDSHENLGSRAADLKNEHLPPLVAEPPSTGPAQVAVTTLPPSSVHLKIDPVHEIALQRIVEFLTLDTDGFTKMFHHKKFDADPSPELMGKQRKVLIKHFPRFPRDVLDHLIVQAHTQYLVWHPVKSQQGEPSHIPSSPTHITGRPTKTSNKVAPPESTVSKLQPNVT